MDRETQKKRQGQRNTDRETEVLGQRARDRGIVPKEQRYRAETEGKQTAK